MCGVPKTSRYEKLIFIELGEGPFRTRKDAQEYLDNEVGAEAWKFVFKRSEHTSADPAFLWSIMIARTAAEWCRFLDEGRNHIYK